MVHAGPCEVLVLNAQSQAVNETLLQDGNWYFHATPGETFSVLLRFTSTTNSYGIDPDMMVHLKLDGVQIGFCHCISLSQNDSTTFKGFIKSGKLFPFKFAETYLPEVKEAMPGYSACGQQKAGTITIKIYNAHVENRPSVFTQSTLRGIPGEKMLDKNKKLWKQPSVTATAADDGIPYPPRHCAVTYSRKSAVPAFTWTGYYHTPGMIEVLKNVLAQQADLAEETAVGQKRAGNGEIEEEGAVGSSSTSVVRITPKKVKKEVEVLDLTYLL